MENSKTREIEITIVQRLEMLLRWAASASKLDPDYFTRRFSRRRNYCRSSDLLVGSGGVGYILSRNDRRSHFTSWA